VEKIDGFVLLRLFSVISYNSPMALPFIPLSEEFEQGQRDFQKFYLENADLHGLSLPEINLTEADLNGANLQGANLSGAILVRAVLTSANLKGTTLHKADLTGANLNGADLEGADLSEADLSRANLRQANFRGANLTRARLLQVDASSAVQHSADKGTLAQRTSFVEAVLREANLSDADLRGCNLQAAVLGGSKLIRTNLSGAVAGPLKDSRGQSKVSQWTGADLTLASLRKAQVMGDFRKANLAMVDLRDGTFLGDFREADLSNALMLNTVMTGSDFTSAKLQGTFLEGCKLNKCLMPNGKPAGWDFEKFMGEPPNPSGRGVTRRQPTYIEYWFETYDEMRALSFPSMCVCCCRTFERNETISREVTISGVPGIYEVKLPFCNACLQHHIRSRNIEQWMKATCAAQGGNAPAVKFEVKSKGILGGNFYFVLSFANMEYVIGFAAGNQLPVKGSKSYF